MFLLLLDLPFGIVGALVLGQAAVTARYCKPDFNYYCGYDWYCLFCNSRFFFPAFIYDTSALPSSYLVLCAGFLGIALGLFVYISLVCSLRSFGVSYTTPFAPATSSNGNGYLLNPIWKREYRPPFVASKRKQDQSKFSMKWKYHNQ